MTVWNNVVSLLTSGDLLQPLIAALLCVVCVLNLICVAIAISSPRTLLRLIYIFFGLLFFLLLTFYGVSEYCASIDRNSYWNMIYLERAFPLTQLLCGVDEFGAKLVDVFLESVGAAIRTSR